MKTETLLDSHVWLRIADSQWANPLDPGFAGQRGGRWNPPKSFPVLYLNEDTVTARLNLRAFVAPWPYEPEDIRDDTGPVLVGATLPSNLIVCDVHSPDGVAAVGLPASYPLDDKGETVGHDVCQPIGSAVRAAELNGIRCRSARSPRGEGRELAWFPHEASDVAAVESRASFADWYWS